MQKYAKRGVSHVSLTILACMAFLFVCSFTFGRFRPVLKKNIIVVHELMPSKFMGGNMRMRQICEYLRRKGHLVTYVFREPLVGRLAKDAIKWARQWNIDLIGDDNELSRLFSVEFKVQAWDVVLLSVSFFRPGKTIFEYFAPYWHTVPRVVLVSDDIHHLRCTRECFETEAECARRKRVEGELYAREDISALVSVSVEDGRVMQEEFRAKKNVVVPMLLETETNTSVVSKRKHNFSGGLHLVYLGTCQEANRLAIKELWSEFIPLLSNKDSVIFAGCTEWGKMIVKTQAQVESIGVVDDIETILTNSTVMLLPAGVGGTGISTKVRLGLQHRVPVVTNNAGARGLEKSEMLFVAEGGKQMLDLCQQASLVNREMVIAERNVLDWDRIQKWSHIFED